MSSPETVIIEFTTVTRPPYFQTHTTFGSGPTDQTHRHRLVLVPQGSVGIETLGKDGLGEEVWLLDHRPVNFPYIMSKVLCCPSVRSVTEDKYVYLLGELSKPALGW
jgi:hypothetical protein